MKRVCLVASLVACAAPVGDDAVPDAGHVGPIVTLSDQRRALGVVELTSHALEVRANRIDKYRLVKDGLPIHGVGFRVRVANGTDEVVDPVHLADAAAAASPVPRISAETAIAAAVAASEGAPSPRGEPPTLAYEAVLGGRTIEALRLAWRVPVIERADRSTPSVIAVVDATTGDVLRQEMAEAHGTANGHGKHGMYTLQVEPTTPLGLPPPDGSVCLADITRGVNITNTNPCGPLGQGIHTFVDLPADGTNPAEIRRVTDNDGTFGDGIYIQTASRSEAEGEHGRTTAADAHHGIARAYDFYWLLGREVLGVSQSIQIRVNNLEYAGNAAYSYLSGLVRVGTHLNNGLGANQPTSTVEILAHEYTHGVLYAEIGSPDVRSQFGAIHEGVGDIFGVLAEASAGGAIVAPASWTWGDTVYNSNFRYFDRPSATGSWDAVTLQNLLDLASGASGVHLAGGVVRRMFYFLAIGAVATTPPTAANNQSSYLPEGMQGIGVDASARILWRGIREHISPGAQPTFLDLRNAMVTAAGELLGSCSDAQKATQDAWAAVNVGTKADRVGPDFTYTFAKSGSDVRVTVKIFPQPNEMPTATVRVDATTQPVPLTHVTGFGAPLSCDGASSCFYGTVYLPVTGQGMHDLEVTTRDACNNAATKGQKFEFDPPSGLSVIDTNYFRSKLRVFRLQAYDSSNTLSYGLQVGSLVKTGYINSGVATDVQFDLNSLPAGTTTLSFWVRDTNGIESSYSQPYYIDRTPPITCGVNGTDLASGGGFRIRAGGCEYETSLEIIDVWVNDAPWWWTDRNYGGDRAITITSPPCGMFERDYLAPFGSYKLDATCADAWGNVTRNTRTYGYTTPPTLSTSVSISASTNTFTISATASSPLDDMSSVQYEDAASALLERDTCWGTSTTCTSQYSATQPAGTTRTYSVTAFDASGRRTVRSVTVTMPMPPPPPTTYAEVENNDRPQTANRPPRTTTRITGRIERSDGDGVCARNSQEFWASCNPYTEPWNCKHACGDYFAYDLAPGQSITYQASPDFHLCFDFGWGVILNVGEGWGAPSAFSASDTGSGIRVTNISSSTRRMHLGAFFRLDPQCATSVATNYTFTIVPPP